MRYPPFRSRFQEGMSRPPCFSRCIFVSLLVLAVLCHLSHADVGTAARYRPPYIPTACNGRDPDQFPSGNLFGAAGEGIWDNGAACGRQYLVRCISSTVARACIQGATIQIKIVDRALTSVSKPSRSDTTMVLSSTAFEKIANPSATYINVEYQQV